MAAGSWPLRAWRRPECPKGRASRKSLCTYMPIKGSGCRHLGRIEPTPCYLRSYTYLLRQHEALLRLAGW